ncbi:hypothetical protein D3C71_1345060 [compost metagenome]
MRGQRTFKVVRAHAQRGGQRGALRGLARQQVGLLVFAILQGMFGAAQVAVGLFETARVFLGHQARQALGMQGFQQAALL